MTAFFLQQQYSTIKLQLKYGWMSLRKEQRRRMQVIMEVINGCLQQTAREINIQQQLDEGIVEELLQSNVLISINSIPTLKLIIYELILYLSQQQITSNWQSLDFSPSLNRISNTLTNIQEVLSDIIAGNQEYALKSIDRKNGKELVHSDRTHRSKLRILSSYYQQFKTLTAQIKQEKIKESSRNSQVNSSDEALIEQLQSLVFKKEGIIKTLELEKEQLNNKIRQSQTKFQQLKDQHNQLFSEKLCIEQERDKLRSQLLQIMRFQPESTIEHEDCPSDIGKCFWTNNQTQKTIAVSASNNQSAETDLMMCLLSQALTIEALLQ